MRALALLFFSFFLFSLYAHANDTAFAKIDVRSIEATMQPGNRIIFQGREAGKIFALLPIAKVAIPSETEKLAKEFRQLYIMSDNASHAISIDCVKVEYTDDGRRIPILPKCTIALESFNKANSDMPVYDFAPVCSSRIEN